MEILLCMIASAITSAMVADMIIRKYVIDIIEKQRETCDFVLEQIDRLKK